MVKKNVSPTVFIFLSLVAFFFFIGALKYLLFQTSIFVIVFLRACLSTFFNPPVFKKLKKRLKKKKNAAAISLILFFCDLGFIYCFVGLLSSLSLMLALAFYLAYPIWTPFILRIWMGLKPSSEDFIALVVTLIAITLSFNLSFHLNNFSLIVALFASIFKAISQLGLHKLAREQPSFGFWVYRNLTNIFISGILMCTQTVTINGKIVALIIIMCAFEKLTSISYKLSLNELSPLKSSLLFNLSIFLSLPLTLFWAQPLPPLKAFISALIFYFAVFLHFRQKKLGPNFISPL